MSTDTELRMATETSDDNEYRRRADAFEARRRELAGQVASLFRSERQDELRISTVAMARRMGVGQSTYSGYEAGTGGLLSIHVIEAFELAAGLEQGAAFELLGLVDRGVEPSFPTFVKGLDIGEREKRTLLSLWEAFYPEASTS
jgi:transcriptional regulator with XRE-family HTH domain